MLHELCIALGVEVFTWLLGLNVSCWLYLNLLGADFVGKLFGLGALLLDLSGNLDLEVLTLLDAGLGAALALGYLGGLLEGLGDVEMLLLAVG